MSRLSATVRAPDGTDLEVLEEPVDLAGLFREAAAPSPDPAPFAIRSAARRLAATANRLAELHPAASARLAAQVRRLFDLAAELDGRKAVRP